MADEWYDRNPQFFQGHRRDIPFQVKVAPKKSVSLPAQEDVQGVDPEDVKFQPAPPMPQKPTKMRKLRRKLDKKIDLSNDNATIGLNSLLTFFGVVLVLALSGLVIWGIVAAFLHWPWWAASLTFTPFLLYGTIFAILKWSATYKEDGVDRAYYY